ncbi:hypothetical protein ACFFYR_18465 [Paraburkholderia dipogonis]|uniref:hypothetical protein n=1 Tax=Paraburkholderia dipogonis TaxID=1211383 RepID=UPI0035EA06E1
MKLENVLAHDGDAPNQSLKSALGQVERIETQVTSLLALKDAARDTRHEIKTV